MNKQHDNSINNFHNNNDNTNNSNIIVECRDLCKIYAEESNLKVNVLQNINLTINKSEMLAIVGPSGCGKSTLLHLLGGLDNPTSGTVYICGHDLNKMSEKNKGNLRNQYLGFVYQFHHLLPEFNAIENVCMPLLLRKMDTKLAEQQAIYMLEKVGLSHRLNHRPGELSGGERQRIAIARALVTKPQCVLADEPTGNLDHKTAESIYELITQLNQEFNTAFAIVTHDLNIAQRTHRTVTLF